MFKFKGKKYNTKRELAEDLGISYDAMLMRMSRGATLKEAASFKPKSSFKYKGKFYRSYAEFIEKENIPLTVNQLKYRVAKTGSLAKALKIPAKDYTVVYKRKKYRSLRVLCEEKGLVYSTIKNRINAGGMSLKDAIDKG